VCGSSGVFGLGSLFSVLRGSLVRGLSFRFFGGLWFGVSLFGSSGVFGSVVSLFGSFLMSLSIFLLFTFTFFCQRERRVAVAELRHVAGLPGGVGGLAVCHTLNRVNTE
jgi:hypothetical protein